MLRGTAHDWLPGAAAILALAVLGLRGWVHRRATDLLTLTLRALPALGTAAIVLSSAPAGAGDRRPAPPSRRLGPATAPPWSGSNGVPPSPPFARAGAPSSPVESQVSTGLREDRAVSVHPAVHRRIPDGAGRHQRLFRRERAGFKGSDSSPGTALKGSDSSPGPGLPERDPSPTASPGCRPSHHAVLPGDSLWRIAATTLGTDDPARVARYWPRIHRANRDVIGPDPDLIIPGQVLELPSEC